MRRLLFVLVSAVLSGLFLYALYQDQNREWTHYQRKFVHSLEKNERRSVHGGIKQLIVNDLHRVDRCTTCHMAIDKPQLALAEEPFTAHPGDYLKWHPPEKFGCTVCHGGQGLATEVKAGHGEVPHWDRPLLRGQLVQASCYKCHGDVDQIAQHVPKLTQGMALFKQLGCVGCHAVNGFGQTVSVDLSDVGDKPLQLLDFTFVETEGGEGEGHAQLKDWIGQHFLDPRKITPGFRKDELPPGEEEVFPTFMPNYGLSDDEAQALTTYMLGLTAESLPAKYVTPPPATKPEPAYTSTVSRGKAVFEKYGCVGCHGQQGMGGRRNFNSQWYQEIPSLVYVKMYYDHDALKEFIKTGRQPVPRINETRPRPPTFMPAWKDRIPDDEIDALVDYLFSLYDKVPQEQAPATSATPAPAAEPAPAS